MKGLGQVFDSADAWDEEVDVVVLGTGGAGLTAALSASVGGATVAVYEKAATVGRRAVKANSEFSNAYKPLIAALGNLGRRAEAAPYIEKLLSLEPNFTAEGFGRSYPFRKPEDRERYMQGLILAGIPKA